MRRQRTTKTAKALRLKLLCIISGCPKRARKWQIIRFLRSKDPADPLRGVRLSASVGVCKIPFFLYCG